MITAKKTKYGSIHFTCDENACIELIELLSKLKENKGSELSIQINFESSNIVSVMNLNIQFYEMSNIHTTKNEIDLCLDEDDVDYSISKFNKALNDKYFEPSEWLNLNNKNTNKEIYLFLFYK